MRCYSSTNNVLVEVTDIVKREVVYGVYIATKADGTTMEIVIGNCDHWNEREIEQVY